MFEERIIQSEGRRISLKEDNIEVGRASLYFLKNDLHKEPFAFLEDVWIREEDRGKGFGEKIVQKAINISKKNNCYKLIGTSRNERQKVHKFYKNLGFSDYGKEFRLDL